MRRSKQLCEIVQFWYKAEAPDYRHGGMWQIRLT